MLPAKATSIWHYRARVALAGLCIVAGVLLCSATIPREFALLAPSEGSRYSLVLESTVRYEQTFLADRASLTEIGLAIHPVSRQLPAGNVAVEVFRGSQAISRGTLPTASIQSTGFSLFTLEPPVTTSKGETLSFRLIIPPALAGTLRSMQRELDNSFNTAHAKLIIDGVEQPLPLAYQLFYNYRPAFALQIGALLILAGVWLGIGFRRSESYMIPAYAVVIAGIAVLPRALLEGWPWPLYATTVVAFLSCWYLLRTLALDRIPSLIGAHSFALTTWFSLHYLSNMDEVLIASLLPLGFLVNTAGRKLFSLTMLGRIALFVVIAAILNWSSAASLPWPQLSDVFFDPNQVAAAQKLTGSTLPWHHYGSYFGFINLGFVICGLLALATRRIFVTFPHSWLLLAAVAAIVLTALPYTPSPYTVIFFTLFLAVLAGFGAQGLWRYLGRDRLATSLVGTLAIIALFDLLYVLSGVLEYDALL